MTFDTLMPKKICNRMMKKLSINLKMHLGIWQIAQ